MLYIYVFNKERPHVKHRLKIFIIHDHACDLWVFPKYVCKENLDKREGKQIVQLQTKGVRCYHKFQLQRAKILYYYVSKKQLPNLYSKSLYKMGHHFLDIQYTYSNFMIEDPLSVIQSFSAPVPIISGYLNSTLNPVIYAMTNQAGLSIQDIVAHRNSCDAQKKIYCYS